jgi:hypothetical protein
MAIIVLFLGIMLVITAYNNTFAALFHQLGSDLPGFGIWAAAIIIIWAVSNVPALRTPAKWFLALLIIVFLLSNHGLWPNLQAAITGQTPPQPPQQTQLPSLVSQTPAPITLNVTSQPSQSGSFNGSALGALSGLGGLGGFFGGLP